MRALTFCLALLATSWAADAFAQRARARSTHARTGSGGQPGFPNPYALGATARSLNGDGAASLDELDCGDWDGLAAKQEAIIHFQLALDSITQTQDFVAKNTKADDSTADPQFGILNAGGGALGNDIRALVGNAGVNTVWTWNDQLVGSGTWQEICFHIKLGSTLNVDFFLDGSDAGNPDSTSGTLPADFDDTDAVLRLVRGITSLSNRETDGRMSDFAIWAADAVGGLTITCATISGWGAGANYNAQDQASKLIAYIPVISTDSNTAVATFGRTSMTCTSSTLEAGDISSDVP